MSTGQDNLISVFQCYKGHYEFLRQISLQWHYPAIVIDVLDSKVIIGHSDGVIQKVNTNGSELNIVLYKKVP